MFLRKLKSSQVILEKCFLVDSAMHHGKRPARTKKIKNLFQILIMLYVAACSLNSLRSDKRM